MIKEEEIAQMVMTNILDVRKFRKEYPITDKKKHIDIALKLLKTFPSFRNKEIALLLGKTNATIQKIRKTIQK